MKPHWNYYLKIHVETELSQIIWKQILHTTTKVYSVVDQYISRRKLTMVEQTWEAALLTSELDSANSNNIHRYLGAAQSNVQTLSSIWSEIG